MRRTLNARRLRSPFVDVERLLSEDRRRVWHPYAPMPALVPPLPIVAAEGVRLRLADGRELVDGMSSWWAAVHGYAHPVLDAAVRDQLGAMSHVMFGGLTHAPAVDLARTLVEITPPGLEHVFFADSGSVSVEVAIKMCLQYQRSRGRAGKHRLMTWRGGYHGDTFGAMSVCDPDGGMHALWRDVLPQQVFAGVPPATFEAAYVEELAELVEEHADELAAVIVEPVVQGAGGMRFHDPRYLHVLRELTLAHDVLLVFDEIATGFGRTGELFAADHAPVAPDVMCVGKALTGGYLTMGATLCTEAVARGISDGEAGVLMHGPTFMANPLAAAVAGRVGGAAARAGLARRGAGDRERRCKAGSGARSRARRGWSTCGCSAGSASCSSTTRWTWRRPPRPPSTPGVWLRPFRDLVYTMPPYVCTPDDLAAITAGVRAAAAAA